MLLFFSGLYFRILSLTNLIFGSNRSDIIKTAAFVCPPLLCRSYVRTSPCPRSSVKSSIILVVEITRGGYPLPIYIHTKSHFLLSYYNLQDILLYHLINAEVFPPLLQIIMLIFRLFEGVSGGEIFNQSHFNAMFGIQATELLFFKYIQTQVKTLKCKKRVKFLPQVLAKSVEKKRNSL